MIKFKSSDVTLDGVKIKGILFPIQRIFDEYGLDVIVTCTTGSHGPDDPHTHGYALDLRVHHIPVEFRQHIRDKIAAELGKDWTVLYESIGTPNSHYHIQPLKKLWRVWDKEGKII